LTRHRKCVALRHLDHDPPGLLELPLRERGWDLEVRSVAEDAWEFAGLASPDLDLLLVLGGTDGAYEADRVPFLVPEVAMLGERLRLGFPVLGICLGAQLMAAALGARVYKGPAQEIGWLPVTPTPAGEADSFFPLLVTPSPVTLQWHGDTFDPPVGTTALGESAAYAAQGFRHGALSYALQFHPEVPFDDLPTWIERSVPPLTGPPETPWPTEIIDGARKHYAAYERQARAFMHAYLDQIERGFRPPGQAW
jgi:GMP synthase (glutamine-hydrolysing)